MQYTEDRTPRIPTSGGTRRKSLDAPFFILVMLLLTIGVIMVLSASFARAYYDPGGLTGGNPAYYFIR